MKKKTIKIRIEANKNKIKMVSKRKQKNLDRVKTSWRYQIQMKFPSQNELVKEVVWKELQAKEHKDVEIAQQVKIAF